MQKRGVFSLKCGTSREWDDGQFVNFTLKRGGVAFEDERGAAGSGGKRQRGIVILMIRKNIKVKTP